MTIKNLKKYRIFRVLILPVVVTTIYLWPQILFYPMGRVLYRNDHPNKPADAIMILMGAPNYRPEVAAKAMMSGLADRIIFVTPQLSPLQMEGLIPTEDVLTLEILNRSGVPRDKILVIRDFGLATSTVDEALAIGQFMDKTGAKFNRMIVVTSWEHTARAGWTLNKALSSRSVTIEMMPVEKTSFDKSNWWLSEDGLISVFEEYIKWVRYLVKYLGRDLT